MRVLVTGGAGFLGSHLCDALLARGDEVTAIDNLLTGDEDNLTWASGHPGFSLIYGDVLDDLPVREEYDVIAHLASPASPDDYGAWPMETLRANGAGTDACIRLAYRCQARLVLASTSEVYGDPLEHPQKETYWGNVNPVGPRSCYDEGKRYAEAMVMAARRAAGVDVGIARIFNTYGPRLRRGDGRVVSNFVQAALAGEPLVIHGDGTQTRSFCYVSDTVAALVALLDRPLLTGPLNVGNRDEVSIMTLAGLVLQVTGSESDMRLVPPRQDDPGRRRPDTTLAHRELGWEPVVGLEEGLRRLVGYYRYLEGGGEPPTLS